MSVNPIPTPPPVALVIDLFCGIGGFTLSMKRAKAIQKMLEGKGVKFSAFKVIACVNHDPVAIECHRANHKGIYHFNEDIRFLQMYKLVEIWNKWLEVYPDALLIITAGIDCTHHSKAKGGSSRNADSRTLAMHLERYIKALNPDYLYIENVMEFKDWGPIEVQQVKVNGYNACPLEWKTKIPTGHRIVKSKKRRSNRHHTAIDYKPTGFRSQCYPIWIPIKERKGEDFEKWRNMMMSYGYRDEWRPLNSADFGAFTARNRFFQIWAKDGLPIVWPEKTHSKNPAKQTDLFSKRLKKWKAVRNVIDLWDEGESIFIPGRIRSIPTFKRVLGGLKKYAVNPIDKDGRFLSRYHGDGNVAYSWNIDLPGPTQTTNDRSALITPKWFDMQYSQGKRHQPLTDPSGALLTVPKQKLYTAKFMNVQYGNSIAHSLEETTGALLNNPKQNLVTAQFIFNPQYGCMGNSLDKPGPVIIAKQDKIPLQLATVSSDLADCPNFIKVFDDKVIIEVYESDHQVIRDIKQFMAENGIIDIKMRMLKVVELLKIQGFPARFKMIGTLKDQKKFIGNSIVPVVVKSMVEALAEVLINQPYILKEYRKIKIAA